tara:strand:- start:233 stop:1525 length:1293 start_codon:yes stop_codon:yes gene_type:complete
MQKIFDKILSIKLKYNSEIVFDTRNIKKNDIFIGIKTQNDDGSMYFKEAVRKGSKLIIINNSEAYDKNIIQIKNTNKFISKFCKYLISIYKGKVIAITGSVGKTTIKENIYHILRKNNYIVYKSFKNFNNELGLQFSIMNMNIESDFSIFELGINSPNEMKSLVNLSNPNYCLVTGIENSHIGNFRNFNNLVNNKIQIFNSKKIIGGLINFAYQKPNLLNRFSSNIKILNIENIKTSVIKDKEYFINFYYKNKKHLIISESDGVYEETAIISYIFLKSFIKKFNSNKFFYKKAIIESRGNVLNKRFNGNKIKIFDHSYNSSPYSLKKQLYFFNKRKLLKKLCIIGSMKELGINSNRYHIEILNSMSSFNFDKSIFIGDEFYQFKVKYKKYNFHKNYKEYIKVMNKDFKIFKNIFIMGSRSNKLERIIDIK